MRHLLPISESDLAVFCQRNHIRKLSVFGSVAKGTAHSGSDLDLLVTFEPGSEPGLMGLASMQKDLSQLAGGVPVDLRTANELSHYFRDDVVRSAVVQYATG
jgi:uncharacterized protein